VLEDGVLRVKNSCIKDGELTVANGKAFVVEGTNNAKLRVQFFWPFRGDYWVIDLAPDYSYAVIGVPSREYCWILSRTSKLDDATYAKILEGVKAKGFDVTRFNRTKQDCG
jgi:apolipoprotein D and lipocalin family protein